MTIPVSVTGDFEEVEVYQWTISLNGVVCTGAIGFDTPCLTTGIGMVQGVGALTVYPDPAADELTVGNAFAQPSGTVLLAIDAQGRTQMLKPLGNGVFDVRPLAPGVYALRYGAYVGRFIKL